MFISNNKVIRVATVEDERNGIDWVYYGSGGWGCCDRICSDDDTEGEGN